MKKWPFGEKLLETFKRHSLWNKSRMIKNPRLRVACAEFHKCWLFWSPRKIYLNVKKKINITQIRSTNSPKERSRFNISDENRRMENANGRHIRCPAERLPHPKLPPRPNTNQKAKAGTLSEQQAPSSVRSAISAFTKSSPGHEKETL